MLWPLMEILQWLFGVTVRQRFYEMRVLSGAMHARNNVTVVTEKVQSLMRIEQQFVATVTLNKRDEKKKSMRSTRIVSICIFHLAAFFLLRLNHLPTGQSTHSIYSTKSKTKNEKAKFEMSIYLQSNDPDNMASLQKYRMHTLCPAPMMSRSIFSRRT